MFSESFKYFFAVTVLDRSNWDLALLAHIYAKIAICKSCEGPTLSLPKTTKSRKSQICAYLSPLSPERHGFTLSVITSQVLNEFGELAALESRPKVTY